jgi:hypothetical protein
MDGEALLLALGAVSRRHRSIYRSSKQFPKDKK